MKDDEVTEIVAVSLKEPSFSVIRASQKDCGYSAKGFDASSVNIKKFSKGASFRLTESDGYPKVTHPFLRSLYFSPNILLFLTNLL